MAATRTQIYLTREQRNGLDRVARREGTSLAQVVRQAVDDYLGHRESNLQAALDATAGALPDLEVPSRDEWDRGYG